MLIFYILISLFIAWIWVDYYRLIDVFEKNHLGYVILVFFMGASSTLLVGPINKLFVVPFEWNLNGEFFNDLLYCTFGIGLIEELCKMAPFFLSLFFLRKHLREPLDYISFIAISALGFSAAENVLYFFSFGSHLIDTRAILCSVGHMFFTSIFAYGIVLWTFHPNYRRNPWVLVSTLLLASLGHGLYDFFLMHEGIPLSFLITIVYFFFCISIFVTILNNALNQSTYFTYKKVVDIDGVAKRIMFYYGVVFAAQFVLIAYERDLFVAIGGLLYSFIMPGIIISVCATRLSRLQLIEGKWNPIKLELPFYLFSEGGINFRIKGSSLNEVYLSKFYHEYVWLVPVSSNRSFMEFPRQAYIESKIHLKNDEVYYMARLFDDKTDGEFQNVLLKPKKQGMNKTKNNRPLVGIMDVTETLDNNGNLKKKYRFKEWVYIKEGREQP